MHLPPVDSGSFLGADIFRELINFTSNAFVVRWGGGSILRLLDEPLLWLLLASSGLLRLTRPYLAILLPAVIFLGLGLDHATLPALAAMPWLIVALSSGSAALVVVASLVNVACGLGLASASFIAAIGLTWGRTGRRLPASLLLIGTAVHILGVILVPYPPDIDFPPIAHVVPDDGVPGMVRPLLGMGTQIPYLDSQLIRATYFAPTLALLCLSLLMLGWLKAKNRMVLVALSCALLLASEVLAPPAISDILPLATLRRIIPHLYFYTLAPLAWGSAVLALLLALSQEKTAKKTTSFSTIAVSLALLFVPNWGHIPTLHALNSEIPFTTATNQAALINPGYSVYKLKGGEYVTAVSVEPTHKKLQVPLTFTAGGGLSSLPHINDNNLSTRWSYEGGKQTPGAWFEVSWSSPTPVHGITLSPGQFVTDYPRGLMVAPCENSPDHPAQPIYTSPRWLGPLHRTATGVPYCGDQRDVTVIFTQALPGSPDGNHTSCLRIVQTGSDRHFDWSVAEVRLLG